MAILATKGGEAVCALVALGGILTMLSGLPMVAILPEQIVTGFVLETKLLDCPPVAVTPVAVRKRIDQTDYG